MYFDDMQCFDMEGKAQWTYERNDNEGGGGGESHNVGPDTRHVQDAHAPGQPLLQQWAPLLVQGNLEVTLQHSITHAG